MQGPGSNQGTEAEGCLNRGLNGLRDCADFCCWLIVRSGLCPINFGDTLALKELNKISNDIFMKIAIVTLCGLFCIPALHAQVSINIKSGTAMVVNNDMVVSGGTFVNNGSYSATSGALDANGGVAFSGTGTTALYDVHFATGASVQNAGVSVYHTATIDAGAQLDANNNLFIRSDFGPGASLVDNGALLNNVKGLVATATVTAGAGPSFTSGLAVNISGTELQYQWQSSADNATWSNVAGATNGTYTALVTTTVYYRCSLAAANTSWHEYTPALKLQITSLNAVPAAPAVSGNISVFPNPNKGVFTVSGLFGSATDEAATITITDVLGKEVCRKQVMTYNGQINTQIKLENEASGMYLVSLSGGGESNVVRVVVE